MNLSERCPVTQQVEAHRDEVRKARGGAANGRCPVTQQAETHGGRQVMTWQRQQQRTEHMEDMIQDAQEFTWIDFELDEDTGSDAMYAEARKRIQTDINSRRRVCYDMFGCINTAGSQG